MSIEKTSLQEAIDSYEQTLEANVESIEQTLDAHLEEHKQELDNLLADIKEEIVAQTPTVEKKPLKQRKHLLDFSRNW